MDSKRPSLADVVHSLYRGMGARDCVMCGGIYAAMTERDRRCPDCLDRIGPGLFEARLVQCRDCAVALRGDDEEFLIVCPEEARCRKCIEVRVAASRERERIWAAEYIHEVKRTQFVNGTHEGDALVALRITQESKCAICHTVLESRSEMQIDHDHATGLIRGLLCRFCNLGLGAFKDDPVRIRSAIRYLGFDD